MLDEVMEHRKPVLVWTALVVGACAATLYWGDVVGAALAGAFAGWVYGRTTK